MVHTHFLPCYILVILLALVSSIDAEEKNTKIHRSSNNWGVLRGTWGKRDWKSAKGMWGKRDDPDWVVVDRDQDADQEMEKRNWNKASGMWGKRSQYADDDDDNQFEPRQYAKRGWEKAAGMWGKRSGWNSAKGMWGRRKRAVTTADNKLATAH